MKSYTANLFRYQPDRLFKTVLNSLGFKSVYVSTKIARHHVYHYKGKGTLPPLVILHGGGDSAGTYLPLLLQLKAHFNEIIAVEAAGHGLSGEATSTYTFAAHYQSINTVIDSLIDPRNPAIIMGNSLGGLTAMQYAVHAPKRVRGLFLLSPMATPLTTKELADLYPIFTPKKLNDVDTFIDRVYHKLPVAKRAIVKRLTFTWITRQAIQDLVNDTTTDSGMSAAELQKIEQPIHILCGKSDRIIPPGALDYFRENIAFLTVSTPPHVGHCPQLENPKLVAVELKRFAKQLLTEVDI